MTQFIYLCPFYSQFVTVECFVTSVSDLFPNVFHKPGRHEIFVLIICLLCFVAHLMLVSEVIFVLF